MLKSSPDSLSPDVVNLLEPIIEGMGFEVVGIDLLGQGRHRTLQVLIDKPEGISVDDCAGLSRSLSRLLDVEDPFEFEYSLEVGSPGVFRALTTDKDLLRHTQDRIKVSLIEPIHETHVLFGTLLRFDDSIMVLFDEANKAELEVERANIKQLNLEPKL